MVLREGDGSVFMELNLWDRFKEHRFIKHANFVKSFQESNQQ
jgi:hypothetical protein